MQNLNEGEYKKKYCKKCFDIDCISKKGKFLIQLSKLCIFFSFDIIRVSTTIQDKNKIKKRIYLLNSIGIERLFMEISN